MIGQSCTLGINQDLPTSCERSCTLTEQLRKPKTIEHSKHVELQLHLRGFRCANEFPCTCCIFGERTARVFKHGFSYWQVFVAFMRANGHSRSVLAKGRVYKLHQEHCPNGPKMCVPAPVETTPSRFQNVLKAGRAGVCFRQIAHGGRGKQRARAILSPVKGMDVASKAHYDKAEDEGPHQRFKAR